MKLYNVTDKEFNAYGKLIECDCSEIITVAEKIEMPENSSTYVPSLLEFESLEIKSFMQNETYGETFEPG